MSASPRSISARWAGSSFDSKGSTDGVSMPTSVTPRSASQCTSSADKAEKPGPIGASSTCESVRSRNRPVVDQLSLSVDAGDKIAIVGATGSGRQLAGAIVGADLVKNEITAHAVATTYSVPDVRTIIEIGGQDSKLILLQDGLVFDFSMNTVCAAGTGSFLDQQAYRLNLPVQ